MHEGAAPAQLVKNADRIISGRANARWSERDPTRPVGTLRYCAFPSHFPRLRLGQRCGGHG